VSICRDAEKQVCGWCRIFGGNYLISDVVARMVVGLTLTSLRFGWYLHNFAACVLVVLSHLGVAYLHDERRGAFIINRIAIQWRFR
tara:strand:- start:16994 stop:17251 length:258 start_codon:yes stop_codon:yes gene_type:complete